MVMNPDTQQLDDLTKLLNRKAFLERFSKILAQARAGQQESPLSLALIDVDEFKLINDQYGHVTGDNVLVAVAKVIGENVGKDALVGRYGGDEFVIIFPGQEREQAFLKLEQIRQVISQHELNIPERGNIKGIPISAGVASFPMDGRTENELWRKADQALYRAKNSGRNQIRLAYEERMVPKTTHYTQTQLERLSKLAEEHGVNEADLLREAMDDFLTKYGVNDIET
jgi:diguanylate cyclase (GGDEF)-like protein